MGGSSNSLRKSSDITELAGKVTVVAIIFLFFVVIFCCCLHLYFKWFYLHRQPTTAVRRRRRRRRLDFAAGHQEISTVSPSSRIGLEPSVLKSIAVVAFDPNEFRDGLECAVCLCEICEGEKARILPKCSHGFHVECIDMWFQSHATCPLCRNPISNQNPSDSESTVDDGDQDFSSSEGPNLPTDVLFWGDENQVNAFGPCVEEDHLAGLAQPSTSSTESTTMTSGSPDGAVVIDINPIQSRN